MRWLLLVVEVVWLSLVFIAVMGALVVTIDVSMPWLLALGGVGVAFAIRYKLSPDE